MSGRLQIPAGPAPIGSPSLSDGITTVGTLTIPTTGLSGHQLAAYEPSTPPNPPNPNLRAPILTGTFTSTPPQSVRGPIISGVLQPTPQQGLPEVVRGPILQGGVTAQPVNPPNPIQTPPPVRAPVFESTRTNGDPVAGNPPREGQVQTLTPPFSRDNILRVLLQHDAISNPGIVRNVPPGWDPIGRLSADPRLVHVEQVSALLTQRPGAAVNPMRVDSTACRDHVELCAWVSRGLVEYGVPPSRQAVDVMVQGIDLLRTRFQGTPLFSGRNVVVGAYRPVHQDGNPHEFGTGALIGGVLTERPSSLEILRAQPSITAAIRGTILAGKEIVAAWNNAETATGPTSRASRDYLTGEMRRVLRLPVDHPIDLTWNSTTGTVSVFDRANPRNPIELFSGNFTVQNGLPTALNSSRLSLATMNIAPASPTEVVNQLVQRIGTAPGGANGFTFVFDGHGDERGLILSGTNPMPGQQAGQVGVLTARMMAEALRARSERFPREHEQNPPVLILANCLSGTFDRQLGAECQRLGIAAPIIISATEHGQLAYANTSRDIPSALMHQLFESRRIEGGVPRSISVGDIISRERALPSVWDSNPVITVPGPLQRRMQISDLRLARGPNDTINF